MLVRTRVACNKMKRFVVGFLCSAFGKCLMVTHSEEYHVERR